MKNLNVTLLLLVASVLFFSSCRKEDGIELSEEEAAEYVEQALQAESGGFSEYISDVVAVYESTQDSCNLSGDTTITGSVSSGLTTYSYSSTYSYSLNCTGFTPNVLNVALSSTSDFNAPRMSGNGNGSGSATLANLNSSFTSYDFDGAYNRSGTIDSKIGQKGSYTSTLSFTMNNVMVDKATQNITGGSATFNLTGNSTGAVTTAFSYSGTVTFNGSGNAIVTLNGNNYTITIN